MIAAFDCNPVGKTGSDSQISFELGIDWLTVVVELPSKEDIHRLLEFTAGMLNDSFQHDRERPINKGRYFQDSCKSVRGALAAWNYLESGRIDLLLSLNGRALQGGESQRDVARLLGYLANLGAKCTRIDAYADDKGKTLYYIRENIERAIKEDNHIGFKQSEKIEKRTRKGLQTTLYLGSRQSESFIRIYDKQDKVRYERELKDSKANEFFSLYCDSFKSLQCGESFEEVIGSLIRDSLFSAIDFRERTDKNLKRCRRLTWWSYFLKDLSLSPLKLSPKSRETSLKKKKDWVENQVIPTLSVLKNVVPMFSDWMRESINRATVKMNRNNQKLVELFRAEMKELERVRESVDVGVLMSLCPVP